MMMENRQDHCWKSDLNSEFVKMALFDFMWVNLLMCRKSILYNSHENLQKQTLNSVLKMIKGTHLVKWSQALLGCNLAREDQMTMPLNHVQ